MERPSACRAALRASRAALRACGAAAAPPVEIGFRFVLDHVSVNVSDVPRSRAFYEAALAPLGYRALMEPVPGIVGFFPPRDDSGAVGSLWITDRVPLSAGHIAFTAPDRATVDAFHRAALE